MKLVPTFLLSLIVGCSGLNALAQQGDERILAAREALRTGDRITLERLAAAPERHLLDHYVEYWLLINRLERPERPPTARLEAFLSTHHGSVPANRLQAYWLRRLANDSDWSGYLKLFADHENPDDELRCLGWHARYLSGDASVRDEVAKAWRALVSAHPACNAVLQATAISGKLSEDEVWWRFRRQIDSRAPEAARTTLSWLGSAGAADLASLDRLLKSPEAFLDRLQPDFASTRTGRELALAAITRVARQDAKQAHARSRILFERFREDERRHIYATLGHHGALSRLPEASEWFREAGSAEMTEAQRSWRIRAALRSGDWLQVAHGIKLLDASEQSRPEWVYWRGRAHAETGRHDDANNQYELIARETHYYGLLAAEELGRSFVLPSESHVVSAADRAAAENDPGIRRALAFYRLDMTTEAVREWIHAVRGRDRAFLIAAAHVALDNGHYDRAINTAELADPGANFAIRFLTPFRDLIEPQARRQSLDLAWIYGLMRQESRFIVPARSSAGARGLMQVMPATGKWVARRIGMRNFHPSMLNEPDTNVLLGTSYMRMIMSDLDDHPVLASAAYNAGPGRAQRWRDQQPIDATIYTATIPFDETRDYVKKVLANKVAYAALFEGRPQSIKKHLGVIQPRAAQ